MKKFLVFTILCGVCAFSCNKASDFGVELIDGNNIDYQVLDTAILDIVSEPGDAVRVYVRDNASLTPYTYLVGNYSDPVFGHIKSDIYAGFTISSVYHGNLATATIDSVSWELFYDTDSSHYYKNGLRGPHSLEVFRITEDLNEVDTTYLTDSFDVENIASASVIDYNIKPLVSDSSSLKFDMNDHFKTFIRSLPDSSFSSSAKLSEYFEGLCIKASGMTEGLISLDMTDSRNALKIYFKQAGSSTQDSIILKTSLASFRHHHVSKNLAGSQLEQYYSNPEGDSLLYMQTLGGPVIKFKLPDLSSYKTNGINYAELELTMVPESGTSFKKPDRIFIFKKNSSGQLIAIDDCLLAIQADLYDAFGGVLEEYAIGGQSVFKYKFRFPQHLTEYIDGDESGELYLSALYGNYIPSRAIFKKSESGKNSINLKLIVSKVN